MTVLDTDHLTVLAFPNRPRHAFLSERMRLSSDRDFATTVVNAEEQMRGWLAEIHRLRKVHDQIPAYERLRSLFEFLSRFQVLSLDDRAANQFERLRKQKIRIGTMDLKIACITVAHEALLLSANLRDFSSHPWAASGELVGELKEELCSGSISTPGHSWNGPARNCGRSIQPR